MTIITKTYTPDHGWVDYDGVSTVSFAVSTRIDYKIRDDTYAYTDWTELHEILRPWKQDGDETTNVICFKVISGSVTLISETDSQENTSLPGSWSYECSNPATDKTIDTNFVVKYNFLGVESFVYGAQTEEAAKFLVALLNKQSSN